MFRVEGREGARQDPAPRCTGCARTGSFTRTLSLFLPVQHNSRQTRDQLVPCCFACITSMSPFRTERSHLPTCLSVSAIWVWWECWWHGDLLLPHPKVTRLSQGHIGGWARSPGPAVGSCGQCRVCLCSVPQRGMGKCMELLTPVPPPSVLPVHSSREPGALLSPDSSSSQVYLMY